MKSLSKIKVWREWRLLVLSMTWFLVSCGVVEKLANRAPMIKKLVAGEYTIMVGDTTSVSVEATDPDEDELSYSWNATGGYFISNQGQAVHWIAPKVEGIYEIEVTVRDTNGGEADDKVSITVMSENKPTVSITQPQDGAYLTALGSIAIEADVSPLSFIDRVEFQVDGQPLGTDKHPPFSQTWQLPGLTGAKKIRVVAWRTGTGSISSADSITVFLQGVIPIPR
jgi:hypothetical protein